MGIIVILHGLTLLLTEERARGQLSQNNPLKCPDPFRTGLRGQGLLEQCYVNPQREFYSDTSRTRVEISCEPPRFGPWNASWSTYSKWDTCNQIIFCFCFLSLFNKKYQFSLVFMKKHTATNREFWFSHLSFLPYPPKWATLLISDTGLLSINY